MKEIRLTYHFEDGIWWADSDSLPGFYAAADTLDEARKEASEGLSFALESDDFVTLESFVGTIQPAKTWGGSIANVYRFENNVASVDTNVVSQIPNSVTKLTDEEISSINGLKQSSLTGNSNTSPSGRMKALA